MYNFFIQLKNRISHFFQKYYEALYVTKNQYCVRFVTLKINKKGHASVIIQVAIKRSKIKMELSHLASNKQLITELHPVDAARVAFLSSLEQSGDLNKIPGYINSSNKCPVIREKPTLKIISQSFNKVSDETMFTIKSINNNFTSTITAVDLLQNHNLLYGLGTPAALEIGYAAGSDFIRNKKNLAETPYTSSNTNNSGLKFYHILCVLYVGLGLSGISIVRRMFPFHIPFTSLTVPFGAGVIFFPLTFAIQDITTEVYGFARSRHMVWLSLFMILLYIFYTQLAIHLPSGTTVIYHENNSFAVVFGEIPRQFASLAVSMLTGILLNDFLISRLKVIYGGRYLWARIIFSTMIGEAVLNIVGLVVGFGDIMHFFSQMLPNIFLSYSYKLLWNVALIPVIYLITGFLKKKEGIDIYDYDTNYNPFIMS